MANNLFLPEKKVLDIEHDLITSGTYTWVAPDKNRDGTDYDINVALYGGGSGSSRYNSDLDINDNQVGRYGGAGAYTHGILNVTPGSTYTLIVGAGSAGSTTGVGGNGGTTLISLSASNIVVCGGGIASESSKLVTPFEHIQSSGTSGSVTISQPLLYSSEVTLSVNPRRINGAHPFPIVSRFDGYADGFAGGIIQTNSSSIVRLFGGVGGSNVIQSTTGSSGRIILRYTLKENITDNVPS